MFWTNCISSRFDMSFGKKANLSQSFYMLLVSCISSLPTLHSAVFASGTSDSPAPTYYILRAIFHSFPTRPSYTSHASFFFGYSFSPGYPSGWVLFPLLIYSTIRLWTYTILPVPTSSPHSATARQPRPSLHNGCSRRRRYRPVPPLGLRSTTTTAQPKADRRGA